MVTGSVLGNVRYAATDRRMSGQLSKSDRDLYLQLRSKYTSGAQAVSTCSCLLTYDQKLIR